jgi:hypothetical protein
VPKTLATIDAARTSDFRKCAEQVRALRSSLQALESEASIGQVAPLQGREWYELIVQKLIPQLTDDAYLVAAVVGGTNIGKSVVFNHIAGCRASATSPLASGTRHPTLIVRGEFVDTHDLCEIFPGFELQPWTQAEDALATGETHHLFWRVNASTPENLLVLDTPDIDSDARINWTRADQIRRCADVLIAVLTQQKYNDAAVKEFFRKAAQEDKAVIIVFNQCQLPDDEAYWPLWIGTFCKETGIKPELVYLAPSDRKAAEENRLPFFERDWPAASAGPLSSEANPPHSLLEDLSQFKFAEVKLRTLRGSLREIVDPARGVPAYLREISARADEFRSAAELLSAHQLAEVDDWPAVPNNLLVAEIRRWWADQREGWSAKVHGFYNVLGRGLTWPLRAARDSLQGPPESPFRLYRDREWSAILGAIEKVFQKLTWLSELGNDLLRPRLQRVLAGTNRLELLETVQQAHRAVDLPGDLAALVASELSQFRTDSPKHYEFFKRIDSVAAAARPATSVVLFMTGFGPVGDALMPMFAQSAMQSVVHVAGDVAGGTMAAAVGEKVLSEGAAQSVGYLEARFRRLHAAFTARRAAWLAGMLQQHVLGDLPDQLSRAAALSKSSQFEGVERLIAELRSGIREPADAAGRR